MRIKEISFFVTGEEILTLLQETEGSVLHRIAGIERIIRTGEITEIHVYQKRYKRYFPNMMDLYMQYLFSFILPPPFFIHENDLHPILHSHKPQGIIFIFDPTKPINAYQATIERLFNIFLDTLEVDPTFTVPYTTSPIVFGVILVNFESLNFDPLLANQFLQSFYPILIRFTEHFPDAHFFEGIYTTYVEPLKEVRRIFNECINAIDSTISEEEIISLELESRDTIKKILDHAANTGVSTIPMEHFERLVNASNTFIRNSVKEILSMQKSPKYTLLGSTVISTDPKTLENEITQLKEQISFYMTGTISLSRGILTFLLDRSNSIRQIIEETKSLDPLYESFAPELLKELVDILTNIKELYKRLP